MGLPFSCKLGLHPPIHTFGSWEHPELGVCETLRVEKRDDGWTNLTSLDRPDLERCILLGYLSSCDQGIVSLVADHFKSLEKAYTQLIQKHELLEFCCEEVLFDAFVTTCHQLKDKRLENNIHRHSLARYVEAIHRYVKMLDNATRHLGSFKGISQTDLPDLFNKKSPEIKRIIEQDIPDYALILCVFLRPRTCRDPIPKVNDVIRLYTFLRWNRISQFAHMARRRDVHYTLYRYNTLIVEIRNQKLTIHDQALFNEYMQFDDEDMRFKALQRGCWENDYVIVTDEMINEVIANGFIPENRRADLMRWVGYSLDSGLMYGATAYGNVLRTQEIFNKEIVSAGVKDIYYAVTGMLVDREGLSPTVTVEIKANYEKLISPEGMRVYNYLRGKVPFEEVGLTASNARRLLTQLKAIEWTISSMNCIALEKIKGWKSGTRLRNRILELSPDMQSFEVFMRTIHPSKMREVSTWLDPRNWHTKRAGLQAKILANHFILARALQQANIIALRGNTGSGKSSIVRMRSGVAARRALNPDSIKSSLKEGVQVLNTNVHREGAGLFWKLFREIAGTDMNYILDTRLIEPEYVEWTVLEPARRRGVGAEILDVDVPIQTSLNRVLTRPVFGHDPCPSVDPVVTGFKQLRQCRAEIIKRLKNEETASFYELRCTTAQIPVARKQDGAFIIMDEELYNESLRVPSDDEIIAEITRTITADYIDEAIARGDIHVEQRPMLEKWIGYPLGGAVFNHAANRR